jgi:hypothetical protein
VRISVPALFFAATLVAPAVHASPRAGLSDRNDEVVLRRVSVPSVEKRQGEVRVLRRGEATVVQTVLHSKVLRRVVGRVVRKERRNWPEGVDGHADAEAYVDALIRAQQDLASDDGRSPEARDRRSALLVEFILSDRAARVEIGEPLVEERNLELIVTASRRLELLELSRPYVERNMTLIVADSFGIEESEARTLLDTVAGR